MDFLNASFKVGRLFDINIRVHILFVIWIGFELVQAGQYWATEVQFLGLLFGVVLLHEFGHCFGARSVGGDAENILMWPLGGLAYAHAPMTPWAQFVTVACGPLVNLVFCIVSGAAILAATGVHRILWINPFTTFISPQLLGMTGWLSFAYIFYQVNLLLLAFNVLPIYPMDGGQLFQCLLWPFVGLQRAMTIACQVGLVGCAGLAMWGLSAGGGRMLLFIALFGGFTCWQRLQQLKYVMVVDERIKYAPYREYRPKRESLLARIFKVKRRPRIVERKAKPDDEPVEDSRLRRVEEEQRREAEVDRILKKVHDCGVNSLSYVERQTLERATRERRERERVGRD